VRAAPTIAFYMGLVCILSLAPFTYMKFFYPDQADMFFNLLAVALLIEFLWTGRFRMLYFFTLAALAASFTRTAGNLMYPVLMAIAFVTVRGRFRHYFGCLLIFVLATGAYQWHRYEIFDMRNQPTIPSGKGMQTFYGTYLYLGDFGYRLSPDLGPNTKHLLEELRQELQPNVRDSALIKRALHKAPSENVERLVFAYTPEELIEKISTEPGEEYYGILMGIDPNDQIYFDVAKEIAWSHPWYVVQYSMRNLWHAVFDPSYVHTRDTVNAPDFMPGLQGWGVLSEDSVTQYGSRAAREMEYFPLKDQPHAIQQIFHQIEMLWLKYFQKYIWITSILVVTAWIGSFAGALCWAAPRSSDCRALMRTGVNKLMAPIIAASALLLYQDLATSMFSQPNHRYFHMTEPLRLVIAGFGVAFAMGMLSSVWPTRIAAIGSGPGQPKRESIVSAIQKYDIVDGYFGSRRAQWISLLIFFNASLFAWWTTRMIARTW
jgi:hypothetical protein